MGTVVANSLLVSADTDLPPEAVIFGQTAAMFEVRQKLGKVSSTNVPVLIRGESGTGKEIMAKLVHACSPWGKGPLVKVSCPAIPGTLLESELFGYERGAFTGAYGSKPGRVEMAHRGTLFLDEIGELDSSLQAKLLQLLQDGQFSRIGANEEKRVEVRIVCATNRNLEEEIETGHFRQDLFYRINVFSITLPSLRERSADIPSLAEYFLAHYNEKFNCRAGAFSARLMKRFEQYHWPGNIRELENIVKRYVILDSEEAITAELMNLGGEAPEDGFSAGPMSLKNVTRQASRELERKIILKVLQEHRWNRKEAARALKISYRALLYKLKEAGLVSQRMSKPADSAAND
jgi:two-component system response regulator AtoC